MNQYKVTLHTTRVDVVILEARSEAHAIEIAALYYDACEGLPRAILSTECNWEDTLDGTTVEPWS